jgi:hypothetical protein
MTGPAARACGQVGFPLPDKTGMWELLRTYFTDYDEANAPGVSGC